MQQLITGSAGRAVQCRSVLGSLLLTWALVHGLPASAEISTYSYDAAGRLATTGFRGATLTQGYDPAGNVVAAAVTPKASASSSSNAYVQKAYVAYYGRAADPAGQVYWASRMDAEGGSLNAIIDAFGNSDEFNRRYGGLNPTQLVTTIYVQTLGRLPDPAGLAYYIGELQAGRRTLQTITLDVLNGATTPPDLAVVRNKLDVAVHYTGMTELGCDYGGEQVGVTALAPVGAQLASVVAAKAAIDTRCGAP